MRPSGDDVRGILPDPLLPRTVYVNQQSTDANYVVHPSGALRSDDAGMSWTTIVTPTVTPALQSCTIDTSPLLPGTLIGQTADKGVASDVRYFSDDSAKSWAAGTCPGDLHGTCPTPVTGSVFGAGFSYAFDDNGIYAFSGRGPAVWRLSISDRLPVPFSTIVDVQGGMHTGDPVYLLAAGLLYRSVDGGNSWRLLTVVQGPTPNLLPLSTVAGVLLVPETHHAVGRAFVAAYKRLGLALTGYPVTEAYQEHGTLYQDFQRLRLQLGGFGAVKPAPLGTILFNYYARQESGNGAAYRRAGTAIAPVANSIQQQYFASTKHAIRAPFLAFWRKMDGASTLGPPMSEVFRATNGDGSGHTYQMQYFANARIELHPELHDARYAVQLGLLGTESLPVHGWQTTHGTQ